MDPKLKHLIERTNIDDLVKPVPAELNFNQPVETASPSVELPARSTSDPLQINFAAGDIAGKLTEGRAGSGVKTFALVFLAGPMILFGTILIAMAWTNPAVGFLRALLASAVGVALAGFWPYLIFLDRRKKTSCG